jgi:hypothetical protein
LLAEPPTTLSPDPGSVEAGAGTYAEVIELLWKAARKGSVAAMQTLRREVGSDGEPTKPSIVDELAKRRRDA